MLPVRDDTRKARIPSRVHSGSDENLMAARQVH
jgi:hypothetical protein